MLAACMVYSLQLLDGGIQFGFQLIVKALAVLKWQCSNREHKNVHRDIEADCSWEVSTNYRAKFRVPPAPVKFSVHCWQHREPGNHSIQP